MLRWKYNTKISNKVINRAKVIDEGEHVENKCGKPRNICKVINQNIDKGYRGTNNINQKYNKKIK